MRLEINRRLGSNGLVYSYEAGAIADELWFRPAYFPRNHPRELTPMATPAATFKTSPRQPTIRDMPTGERPRERLVEYGSKNLSNTELVAILLRTGSAGENVISLSSRLLTRFGGLAGLGKAAFAELCGEKGLSEAK
ncbi:MAG: hypothetical protein IIA92_15055, partial [Chloroflexi bacterium]|nr:hypothetical protein [Chloroflexota bacterium]